VIQKFYHFVHAGNLSPSPDGPGDKFSACTQ